MNPEEPQLEQQPTQQAEEPDQQPQVFDHRPRKKLWVFVVLLIILVLGVAGWLWFMKQDAKAPSNGKKAEVANNSDTAEKAPKLQTETVITGLEHVWEVAFLPSKEMLFTERKGVVSLLSKGKTTTLATITDVYARGEGGLMGLAVDPKFATNQYIYTCFNSTAGDIRVVRWTVKPDMSTLSNRSDIVTGIESNSSGRHSGCRIAFGPDDYLWIGTGDTAQDLTPQSPQDPKSLAGKILRVTRIGAAASGNLKDPYDARIYSYGHRNTQGIAFFDQAIAGSVGVSAEHGPDVDDELNPLKPGNFGWAPPDGPYKENVPMTDKERYPAAVDAIWESDSPTQAPAGIAVIKGEKWGAWNGAVVMAMLKDEHVKVLTLDKNLKVTNEERHFENDFGRLRTVVQGPDGNLYLGTTNGAEDMIIRVIPE